MKSKYKKVNFTSFHFNVSFQNTIYCSVKFHFILINFHSTFDLTFQFTSLHFTSFQNQYKRAFRALCLKDLRYHFFFFFLKELSPTSPEFIKKKEKKCDCDFKKVAKTKGIKLFTRCHSSQIWGMLTWLDIAGVPFGCPMCILLRLELSSVWQWDNELRRVSWQNRTILGLT